MALVGKPIQILGQTNKGTRGRAILLGPHLPQTDLPMLVGVETNEAYKGLVKNQSAGTVHMDTSEI